VIAGGIDETRYRTMDAAALRAQADEARRLAGAKFILAPGCSVPNDATPEELHKLHRLFTA
jgi:uroporphyrinogen-III decarboxylase